MEPRLTAIQVLAAEWIWTWFDDLWEREQVDPDRFRDLQADVIPLFERLDMAPVEDRNEAIVDLVGRLREIDQSVLRPS